MEWGYNWDDPESPVGPNAATWKPISDNRIDSYRKYLEDQWDSADYNQSISLLTDFNNKEEYVDYMLKDIIE